jgi:hypothetical protein
MNRTIKLVSLPDELVAVTNDDKLSKRPAAFKSLPTSESKGAT